LNSGRGQTPPGAGYISPPAGDLVLLTNVRFIREPNLYFPNIDGLFARDCIQARWELFLKSAMAPSACA
jgi:hypothetical protein